jgi:preprotein translocase subunit SecE
MSPKEKYASQVSSELANVVWTSQHDKSNRYTKKKLSKQRRHLETSLFFYFADLLSDRLCGGTLEVRQSDPTYASPEAGQVSS